MLQPFEIHQPRSIGEAAEMRARFGPEAAVYAGGTELLLVMKEGLVHYPNLIDIKIVSDLAVLEYDPSRARLRIGATVSHRHVERAAIVREHFPVLAEMAAQVANVRVRNVGTLGGNLCFAEPHADPPTLLLAYGAEVVLESVRGERRLPVAAFITGPYETALAGDEVLSRIEVPRPRVPTAGAYVKFGLHERPSVNVAALLTLADGTGHIRDARVTVGCVGPTAGRLADVERRLVGVSLADVGDGRSWATGAGDGIDAVSDLHGSADYKRHLVDVFVARALSTAARRGQDR